MICECSFGLTKCDPDVCPLDEVGTCDACNAVCDMRIGYCECDPAVCPYPPVQ